MRGGLVESLLGMTADVYRQTEEQDPNTGAIIKEWNYYKTVPCSAKGIISNSTSSRTGDRQVLNNKYQNEQFIQVRTIERLTTREKITNIKSSDNVVIWRELDFPAETPTVFEVVGMTPITDPYGEVLAYNSTLKRSENQQIGL